VRGERPAAITVCFDLVGCEVAWVRIGDCPQPQTVRALSLVFWRGEGWTAQSIFAQLAAHGRRRSRACAIAKARDEEPAEESYVELGDGSVLAFERVA
jgi:hypothetical protein